MRRPVLALIAVVALVGGLAACGDDDGDEGGAAAITTEAGAPSTTAAGETATTGGDTTTTTGGSTTTAAPEDLPGEVIDLYPYEGAALAVVGVAADDTLNVRAGPGTDSDVVTEAAPTSVDLVATGANRQLDDGSVWAEVTTGEATGWVNVAYVSEPGAARDITAEVPAASGETLAELAEVVAASRTFEGEGPQPTVTVVAGPTDTEVTVDVLGLADDAQEGERLVIEGALATGGTGYAVVSVESTPLCGRGVTADGLCT